jgi:hypothetical protein
MIVIFNKIKTIALNMLYCINKSKNKIKFDESDEENEDNISKSVNESDEAKVIYCNF